MLQPISLAISPGWGVKTSGTFLRARIPTSRAMQFSPSIEKLIAALSASDGSIRLKAALAVGSNPAPEFVDAMAADNQKLCDRMDVEELPHSICFFEETMKPVHGHKGFIDAQSFMNSVVHRLSGGKKSAFKPSILPTGNIPSRIHSKDSDLLK